MSILTEHHELQLAMQGDKEEPKTRYEELVRAGWPLASCSDDPKEESAH
jgi:hypothetical protein